MYAKTNNITIRDIYLKLLNGEKLKFDLRVSGKVVKYSIKAFTVENKLEFTREICF